MQEKRKMMEKMMNDPRVMYNTLDGIIGRAVAVLSVANDDFARFKDEHEHARDLGDKIFAAKMMEWSAGRIEVATKILDELEWAYNKYIKEAR